MIIKNSLHPFYIPYCNLLLVLLNRDMKNSLSCSDLTLYSLLLHLPSVSSSLPQASYIPWRFPHAPRFLVLSKDRQTCRIASHVPEVMLLFKNSYDITESRSAWDLWEYPDTFLVAIQSSTCVTSCSCLPVEPCTSYWISLFIPFHQFLKILLHSHLLVQCVCIFFVCVFFCIYLQLDPLSIEGNMSMIPTNSSRTV